jgi:hypothetical protein
MRLFGADRSLTMAKPAMPPRLATVSDLRQSLEEALANGAAPKDLVMRLTLRDSALIKRSRLFADTDIRFKDGEMLILGVRAVIGSTASSGLERAPIAATK